MNDDRKTIGLALEALKSGRVSDAERILQDALHAVAVDSSSMLSWSGFNVYGDHASIREVERALHYAWTVPELKDRIADLSQQIEKHPDWPCRSDGRCQYAIDSGAEGMGHCPRGKCVMNL